MLTSIDVKFIFDSARLRLFSSANILQLAEFSLRVVSLKRVKCPPFLFSQPKTAQPRPQVFSVNGALTFVRAALLTSSVD